MRNPAQQRQRLAPCALPPSCTQLHPDYLIVFVASLSARGGCLDLDPFEVEFKQAAGPRAETVIAVADASKFEAPGLITSLPWDNVQVLVTAQAMPADLAHATRELRVVIAEDPTET